MGDRSTRMESHPLMRSGTVINPLSEMGKPDTTGRPDSPGKSADAPGQRFRDAGLDNASTLTRGFTQKGTKGTRG